MAIDERSRHELFSQLERTLGEEAATTLMEHLPPAGWGDVATRRDLDLLRADFRAELSDLRADFRGELNSAMTAQTRAIVFSTVGSVAAVAGIVAGLT